MSPIVPVPDLTGNPDYGNTQRRDGGFRHVMKVSPQPAFSIGGTVEITVADRCCGRVASVQAQRPR
jgi:hypothetical protein